MNIVQNQSYNYYVTAEDADGRVSQPSNWAPVPSDAPMATFKGISESIARLTLRAEFKQSRSSIEHLKELSYARNFLTQRSFSGAESRLKRLLQKIKSQGEEKEDKTFSQPSAEDMEIMVGKLLKRVRLVQAGLLSPSDLY
jgi:hypothetical protein